MKIINRLALLEMPAGTLFSEYEPCFFGPLMIKGETLRTSQGDWYEQPIADAISCDGSEEFSDKLFRAQETGESIAMDFHCEGRDGLFDQPERLYAAWEPADLKALIARLQECLPEGKSDV